MRTITVQPVPKVAFNRPYFPNLSLSYLFSSFSPIDLPSLFLLSLSKLPLHETQLTTKYIQFFTRILFIVVFNV